MLQIIKNIGLHIKISEYYNSVVMFHVTGKVSNIFRLGYIVLLLITYIDYNVLTYLISVKDR